jgi:hypothetical protein
MEHSTKSTVIVKAPLSRDSQESNSICYYLEDDIIKETWQGGYGKCMEHEHCIVNSPKYGGTINKPVHKAQAQSSRLGRRSVGIESEGGGSAKHARSSSTMKAPEESTSPIKDSKQSKKGPPLIKKCDRNNRKKVRIYM